MSDRLSRNPELKYYESVEIIGCGGIGTWVGIILGLSGQVDKLYLNDMDVIEIHNLNRLPFDKNWIGKNKAEALKDFIKRIDDDIFVFANPNGVNENSILLGDMIIDCTDRTVIQKMLAKKCLNENRTLYRCGSDAEHISVFRSFPQEDWLDEEETTGYEEIPSWAGSGILPAMFLCIKLLMDVKGELYHENMKKIIEKINMINEIESIDISDMNEMPKRIRVIDEEASVPEETPGVSQEGYNNISSGFTNISTLIINNPDPEIINNPDLEQLMPQPDEQEA